MSRRRRQRRAHTTGQPVSKVEHPVPPCITAQEEEPVIIRTVESPAGETIELIPDEQFMRQLPDVPSNSMSLLMRFDERKRAVLTALWNHGAFEDRQSGRATQMVLSEAAQYGYQFAQPAHVTSLLDSPGPKLCIEREIGPKRTYRWALRRLPESWYAQMPHAQAGPVEEPPAVTFPDPPVEDPAAYYGDSDTLEVDPERPRRPARSVGQYAPTSTNGDIPDSVAATVEVEIASSVATALLSQVVAIIHAGNATGPELGKLRSDLEESQARLAEQTGYAMRLRQQLSNLGDELSAVKYERDGLRTRLRSAEHNLKVATTGDTQRIIDAEVRKALDKLMRQAPDSPKASV